MLSCPKCGQPNTDHSMFCPSCGTRTDLGQKNAASYQCDDYRAQVAILTFTTIMVIFLSTFTDGPAALLFIMGALAAYALTFFAVRSDVRARRSSTAWVPATILLGPIGAAGYLVTHLGTRTCKTCGYPIYGKGDCAKCTAANQYKKLCLGAPTATPKYDTSTRSDVPTVAEPDRLKTPTASEAEQPRQTNLANTMTDTDLHTFMAQTPSLIVVTGSTEGKKFRLSLEETKIGRGRTKNDVVISDDTVSRNHAVISFEKDGNFVLRDNGSTNHTFLTRDENRKRIKEINLQEGDLITIGDTELRFQGFTTKESANVDQLDPKLSSTN